MDINTSLDLNSIICTVIPSIGTVLATLLPAIIARKVVKEDIQPIFHAYSDKSYDLSDLIGKAKHNIVIMGSSGYRILQDYGSDLEEKLDCGVSVYYLFLSQRQLLDMERYRHGGDAADAEIYPFVKETLKKWNDKYNNEYSKPLQAREFSHFMTAAYVGVDIPFGEESGKHFPDAMIQVVQYQYGRRAKDSPLTYLSWKRDRKQFKGTVESMMKMWTESADCLTGARPGCDGP